MADPSASELIAEILEDRALRAKALREPLQADERSRLRLLDESLRSSSDQSHERREYRRFDCRFPVRIELIGADGASEIVEGEIADLSAGGAKVMIARPLASGQAATIRFIEDARGSEIRFEARVAWGRPGCVGLMFAGAATKTAPDRITTSTVSFVPQPPTERGFEHGDKLLALVRAVEREVNVNAIVGRAVTVGECSFVPIARMNAQVRPDGTVELEFAPVGFVDEVDGELRFRPLNDDSR